MDLQPARVSARAGFFLLLATACAALVNPYTSIAPSLRPT